MSFRPLLITEVDRRKISTYFQLNEIDKLFSYINEMLYQSYQNGMSQGVAEASTAQNFLIGKLVNEVNSLRPLQPPIPMTALGEGEPTH